MPMSRVPILLLFTVSTISALGHAQPPVTRTSQPVAMNLSHITELNRNVVAADFNGDGIIDLAASDVSPAAGISSTGSVSSATGSNVATLPGNAMLPAGNVSSVGAALPVNTGV